MNAPSGAALRFQRGVPGVAATLPFPQVSASHQLSPMGSRRYDRRFITQRAGEPPARREGRPSPPRRLPQPPMRLHYRFNLLVGRRGLSSVCLFLASLSFASGQLPDIPEGFEEEGALFLEKCISCHSIGQGERVATDLKGITRRRTPEWLAGFLSDTDGYLDNDPLGRELTTQYFGLRMPQVELTAEEFEGILRYIAALDTPDPGPFEGDFLPPIPADSIPSPLEPRGLWMPGLMALLGLIAAGGGLYAKGHAKAAQLALALCLGAGYAALGGRWSHALPENDRGYAPEQPIAFSHALHAGELGVACLYCHPGARRSPVAGVPDMATCMNCHRVVRKRTTQTEPSPEIARLVAAWESRDSGDPQPIRWKRVHNLPDFVRFSHEVHVRNDVQCAECHGPVETMERVRQAATLSMGMCIECHRLQAPEAPPYWDHAGATQDCAACHH